MKKKKSVWIVFGDEPDEKYKHMGPLNVIYHLKQCGPIKKPRNWRFKTASEHRREVKMSRFAFSRYSQVHLLFPHLSLSNKRLIRQYDWIYISLPISFPISLVWPNNAYNRRAEFVFLQTCCRRRSGEIREPWIRHVWDSSEEKVPIGFSGQGGGGESTVWEFDLYAEETEISSTNFREGKLLIWMCLISEKNYSTAVS